MAFLVEEKLPKNYFQEVMNSQTEMVRTYLDDLDNPVIFSTFCGTMMATFRFYSYGTVDVSPLLHYTFSNLGDLKDQLYYFWLQIIYLLKES